MDSIWSDRTTRPLFPSLKKDTKTDVLIIGGGIAGILCAHALSRAGVDCVLVEAKRICSGITRNTTAKITSQHGLCYHKLLTRFGQEQARMYLRANQAALDQFRALSRKYPCHFEEQDAFAYSLDGKEILDRELAALDALDFPAEYAPRLHLPFETCGAVRFPNQAQFHPLEFLYRIAEKLTIFENTTIRELVGTTAVTDRGKIRADKIIVATHFPFLNKHGLYFLKLYQQRSYVLALKQAQDVEGMYIDGSGAGLSFRNYEDLLLLGGGGHRTGKTGGNWAELERFANIHYPGAPIVRRWATQDCMSLDGVPYIGPYSRNTDNLYVATGFGKWGMTSSMAAALILTDMVQGRTNDYAPVFSPSRSILRPQLLINAGEAAINLLTPTRKRCPHMGCALKWNPQEHSWDCPCHGSRFTGGGKLIDNPATGDIKTDSLR